MAIINNFPQSRKPILQSKAITPTKGEQTIVPDEKYDALSSVKVAAIPDKYQDVSNVDVEANDVANGKVFVDAEGVEQTGSVRTVESGGYMALGDSAGESSGETNWQSAGTSSDGKKIWCPTTTVAYDRLIRSGANIVLDIYTSRFGDATPGDVIKGKTFSSIGGVAETGTLEYVTGRYSYDDSGVAADTSSEKVILMADIESDLAFKAGSSIWATTPYSSFGDAETSDVLLGKIFTSAAGLKKTGTYVGGKTYTGTTLGTLCDFDALYGWESGEFGNHEPDGSCLFIPIDSMYSGILPSAVSIAITINTDNTYTNGLIFASWDGDKSLCMQADSDDKDYIFRRDSNARIQFFWSNNQLIIGVEDSILYGDEYHYIVTYN